MIYNTLHEFTPTGMLAFARVFAGSIADSVIDLSDADIVSPLPGSGQFEVREFASAKEMAAAILLGIGSLDLQEMLPRGGLWAWLTFVLRNQLFTRETNGRWIVGELHRWYPSNPNDWQKGQRHLVRMPVLLLHSFGDNADHLLCTKPSVLPEIREQLTSQQDMFNVNFQAVARELYFDSTRGSLKRGAGGKGGGSPRRLAKVRQQLDVTWDLDELDFERIMSKLPPEFDRFRKEGQQIPSTSRRTQGAPIGVA